VSSGGLEEAPGWWSADGRERGTELGMGAPMETGQRGFEPAEGGLRVQDGRAPFYSRRAPDRGNGVTGGPQRVAGGRGRARHVVEVTPRRLGSCTCLGKRGASGGATSGGARGLGRRGRVHRSADSGRRAGGAVQALAARRGTRVRSALNLFQCAPISLCFTQNFSTKVH
jgi:hypothetical protein